jgi:hypothetical protein
VVTLTRGPRRYALALALALVCVFVLAAAVPAFAAVRIRENWGVSNAKLGMTDSAAIRVLGRPARSGRDTSYARQVVYYFYWGRRMSNGKYPLQMYSRGNRIVFTFICNSNAYATAKGIKVGSLEKTLTKAYGAALKRYRGSVYTRYALGGRTGTDFYVRRGVVTQIVVRTN